LASAAGFTVIRSDEVRKELAGLPVTQKGEQIYTPEWAERTYHECGRRAWQIMGDGGRVVVDASFVHASDRAALLYSAPKFGLPAVCLVCQADSALVRERLRARRGDASDADERVYDELAKKWETGDPRFQRQMVEIDTTDAGRALDQALDVLRGMGLV
jgi:predicted kinase